VNLWKYANANFASAANAPPDTDSDAASTEFLRVRLKKWCETGIEKITEDFEGLEMHSAVRNVMRLFERIKGFEKLVVQKRGELVGEDLAALVDALGLLAAVLAPLAPHIAEELWIVSGREELEMDIPWPTLKAVA